MEKESRILVTGADGMVGKNLVERLKQEGFTTIIAPSKTEADLRLQRDVERIFAQNSVEYVFHLAAKVGGIQANMTLPAEFLYDNLAISSNVIHASKKYGVKKMLNLGSSCIYPRETAQPMKEEQLLTGKLEKTNEGYAIGKIAALKMCEYYNKQYGTNFISLMPPNMYGVYDHFDSANSHVISAMVTKMHNAKIAKDASVPIWGTGNARREFLFVGDAVEAMLYFMQKYDAKDLPAFVNIGSNADISIKDLAYLIKDVVGFEGELTFDTTKPDGMMKKLVDSSKAKELGYTAKTSLRNGLEQTYKWWTSCKQ